MKQFFLAVLILCTAHAGYSASPQNRTIPVTEPQLKIFALFAVDAKIDAPPPDLSDPLVYGASRRFRWRTLEPREGEYDFEPIDRLLAMSTAAGKPAMIRVTAGIFSPDWLYADGAEPFEFTPKALATGRDDFYPKTMRMPVPWDEVFLSKWGNFIRALGQRYNGKTNLYCVQMTGGGWIGEMNLPKDFARRISAMSWHFWFTASLRERGKDIRLCLKTQWPIGFSDRA